MRTTHLLLAALTLALAWPVLAETPASDAGKKLPDSQRDQWPQLEEIIVVFKTHFDIGYTHRVKDLLPYYRTQMIDSALNAMDKMKALPADQQFLWTMPGWPLLKAAEDWPGQTPARRQRIADAIKSGRLLVHALPFSIESEIMDPEDCARSFQASSTIARRYGLPLPRDAKTTDIPAQSLVLATTLAHGGVKFVHIGENPACYPMDIPPLSWWEGPDGSRVMLLYTPHYGSTTALLPVEWGLPRGATGHNLLPPKGWPYKTWVAILVTSDNSGPPTPASIKAFFNDAQKRLPGVKVRMGHMADFADAIVKSGAALPVLKADTPDTWNHGAMCDPGGMKTARNLHPLMPAAEALNTTLRQWGMPLADPAKDIAKAYEQSALYAEHTWGGSAMLSGYGKAFHPEKYPGLEAAWEDKTNYIRTADQLIRPLLAADLTALAKGVKAQGKRAVVYNALPWARSGTVEVDGKPMAVADVPPGGYKTICLETPANAASPANATVLENDRLKIAFDPVRGTLASFIDKRTGREWVDAGAAQGLGQYLNERFTLEQTRSYVTAYQDGRGGPRPHQWNPHRFMYKPGMVSEKVTPYRAASPAGGALKITRQGPE